jgi:hypothetical protein
MIVNMEWCSTAHSTTVETVKMKDGIPEPSAQSSAPEIITYITSSTAAATSATQATMICLLNSLEGLPNLNNRRLPNELHTKLE